MLTTEPVSSDVKVEGLLRIAYNYAGEKFMRLVTGGVNGTVPFYYCAV